jgi:hypothetical protein
VFKNKKQLAALGNKQRARLGWPFFGREIFTLKTMLFRDILTVLNERKHLKMVIWSVPDSVSLIQSTDSHILKVRIELSLYNLGAGLKRYEGKKH